MKKIYLGSAALISVIGAAVLGVMSAGAQMTSSTLGTAIDSVNSTTYDYFLVLLNKYWPFVVGFLILLGVWRYGRGILHGFTSGS